MKKNLTFALAVLLMLGGGGLLLGLGMLEISASLASEQIQGTAWGETCVTQGSACGGNPTCAYPTPCDIETYCGDSTHDECCEDTTLGIYCSADTPHTCTGQSYTTTGPCQWAMFSPGTCGATASSSNVCTGSVTQC